MSSDSLIEARFVRRRNRFAADVEVDGVPAVAHVPNSGRMTELLTPGAKVLLRPYSVLLARPSPSMSQTPDLSEGEGRVEGAAITSQRRRPGRGTAYDLVMAWYNNRWAGIDARLPPVAVIAAWRAGMLPSLTAYDRVRREVRFADSRLDLLFEGQPGLWYVEAKSVNLVEDGIALFPDAPTVRGTRHLGALVEAVHQGHRAALAFVVQRDDAMALLPHPTADPAFAMALGAAMAAGVEAWAIVCEASAVGLLPLRLAPVLL